jgi:hypothetical protein
MSLYSCIVVDESHSESLKVMSNLIVLKLNLLFLHRWVYLCFAQKFGATSYLQKLTTTIAIVVGIWTSSQALGIIGNKRKEWGGVAFSSSFISSLSLSLSLCYNSICRKKRKKGGGRAWNSMAPLPHEFKLPQTSQAQGTLGSL